MNVELKEREQWSELRNLLIADASYNDHWRDAIELFNTRLQRKYFTPLELLIKARLLDGEGFTILTIQCSLIEMFAAFREGKIFSYIANGNPNHYYRDSQQLYLRFLRSESIFENNFWRYNQRGKVSPDFPFSADDFYLNVRCALLHEARTKSTWIINASKSDDVQNETLFLSKADGKIKIYRTVLHHRLIAYMNEYLGELRNEENTELRTCFARKLDNLFDYEPNTNFYWWI